MTSCSTAANGYVITATSPSRAAHSTCTAEFDVLSDAPPYPVRPRWGAPRWLDANDTVPAVIAHLVARSWERFEHPEADEAAMGAYLSSRG